MSSQWVVHKFGGTSLADAERYRRVAAILRAEKGERKAVVVSAMGKVTDDLGEVFAAVTAHVVPFHNPVLETEASSTVYVAKKAC